MNTVDKKISSSTDLATEYTEVTENSHDRCCIAFLRVLGERSAELTSKPLWRKAWAVFLIIA